MFRLRNIVIEGHMGTSGNLSFAKRNLVGWLSGSRTQRDVIALAKVLCDSVGGGGAHFG
jgi:hypothetical protein